MSFAEITRASLSALNPVFRALTARGMAILLVAGVVTLFSTSAFAGGVDSSCAPWKPCDDGLFCDFFGFTCQKPAAESDWCHATRPCGTGLTCTAFKCVKTVTSTAACDPTGQFKQCGKGLYCHPLALKCVDLLIPCVPGPAAVCPSGMICSDVLAGCVSNEAEGEKACRKYYDQATHNAARAFNVNYTYGLGASLTQVAGGSVETGVVYGANGKFGCYRSVCSGVATTTGVSGWATAGVVFRYDAMAGSSLVLASGVGASKGWFPLSADASFTMGFSNDGVLTSESGAVGLTVGMGLPFVSAGVWSCETKVKDISFAAPPDLPDTGTITSFPFFALADPPLVALGGGSTRGRTVTPKGERMDDWQHLIVKDPLQFYGYKKGALYEINYRVASQVDIKKLSSEIDAPVIGFAPKLAACAAAANDADKAFCARGFLFTHFPETPWLRVYVLDATGRPTGAGVQLPVPWQAKVLVGAPRGTVYTVWSDGSLRAARVEFTMDPGSSSRSVRWAPLGPTRETWTVVDANPGWKTCDQIAVGNRGDFYCRIGGDLYLSQMTQGPDWRDGLRADFSRRRKIGTGFEHQKLIGGLTGYEHSPCDDRPTEVFTYSPNPAVIPGTKAPAKTPALMGGPWPNGKIETNGVCKTNSFAYTIKPEEIRTKAKTGGVQLCLKPDGFALRSTVSVAPCDGSWVTKWNFFPIDPPWFQVQYAGAPGMCLSVIGYDQTVGARAQLFGCNPTVADPQLDNQWRIHSEPDGSTVFINRASGNCLGLDGKDKPLAAGTPADVYPCDPSPTDRRADERWSVQIYSNHTFKHHPSPWGQPIVNKGTGRPLCLDAEGLDVSAQGVTCAGTGNQVWGVQPVQDTAWARVKNRKSGGCLGVEGGDTHAAAAAARVTACDDKLKSQNWAVVIDGERRTLVNEASGLCLGLRGTDDGRSGVWAEVHSCDPTGTDARMDERWDFAWHRPLANHARHKTVSMSSQIVGKEGWRAVDGLSQGDLIKIERGVNYDPSEHSNAVTEVNANPWLEVDLGSGLQLQRIEVHTEDAPSELVIRLSQKKRCSEGVFVWKAPKSSANFVVNATLPKPTEARYVCVSRECSDCKLSVAEVKAWGKP